MGDLLSWYGDRWQWALDSDIGALVLVGVASFFALALVAGALGVLMQGFAFARDAFMDGWRNADEDDPS